MKKSRFIQKLTIIFFYLLFPVALVAQESAQAIITPVESAAKEFFEFISLILIVLMAKVGFVASAVLVNAMRTDWVVDASTQVKKRPVLMFFVGFVDLVLFFIVLRLSSGMPLLVALELSVAVLVMLPGIAAVYQGIASKISETQQTECSLVKAGAICESATLIPILGQLVNLVVLCQALGVGILLLFKRKSKEQSGAETSVTEA